MLLKIKNKSRFVAVSFLLASLVTVISSASANETENIPIPFTVEEDPSCSDGDVPATWAPVSIHGAIFVNPGDYVTVTVNPNFLHGSTACGGYSLGTTGHVINELFVPDGWTSETECPPGTTHCIADPAEREIQGSFTVPSGAVFDDYEAIFSITWMIP